MKNLIALILIFIFNVAYTQDCEDPIEQYHCDCEYTDCNLALTIQKHYTYDNCLANDVERKSEVSFEFLGVVTPQVILRIEYDDDLFTSFTSDDITANATGPDANGIITVETSAFSVFSDLPKLRTLEAYPDYASGSPEIAWEVFNASVPTNVLSSGIITFPAFTTIDGTSGSGISVSSAIGLSDLLSAAVSAEQEQYIRILGTLIVDQDYTFSRTLNGGSQIVMGPGAEIIIESGNQLNLFGTQLYGCTNLWKSITVEDGARLKTGNRTRIEDGFNAVYIEPNYTGNPTNLSIHWTEFINNYIGIRGSGASSQSEDQNINFLRFAANTFAGRGDYMLTSYTGMPSVSLGSKPFAAINAFQWPLLVLHPGPTNFFGLAWNSFENMENGIIANNTDLGLYSARFKDIENSAGNGYAVLIANARTEASPEIIDDFVYFENCNYGIASYKGSLLIDGVTFEDTDYCITSDVLDKGDAGVEIINNEIDYNIKGVSVAGQSYIQREIAYNEFTTDGILQDRDEIALEILNTELTGRYPLLQVHDNTFNLDRGLYAISLNNCEKVHLYSNDINILDVGSGPTTNTGVRALECGQFVNFNCNTVDMADDGGNDNGIIVINTPQVRLGCFSGTVENGIRAAGSSGLMDVEGNCMDGRTYDLVYEDQTLVGIQNRRGNLFTETMGSSYEAINLAQIQFFIRENEYRFDPTTIATGGKTFDPDDSPSDWFVPGGAGSTFYCESNDPDCDLQPDPPEERFKGMTPTTLDSAIVEGVIPGEDSLAFNWTAQRHLFKGLQYATVAVDPYFSNFKSSFSSTSGGKFERVTREIQEAMELDATMEELLTSHIENRETALDSIQSKIEAYLDSEPDVDSLDYSFLDTFKQLVNYYSQEIDSLHTLIIEDLRDSLDVIQSFNDNISTSAIYESNTKQYNQILIRVLKYGADSLTAANIDSLESIAGQCHRSGGSAVFKAQALLHFYDAPREFDLEDNCTPPQAISVPYIPEIENLVCFPNPAGDELNISFPKNMESGQGMLIIYDLTGRVVLKQIVQTNATQRIDLHLLANGTYIGEIRTSDDAHLRIRFTKNDAK